jgi:hypothetical protein
VTFSGGSFFFKELKVKRCEKKSDTREKGDDDLDYERQMHVEPLRNDTLE